MSPPLRVRAVAPAKVNLGLEITERRPDGFHEIVSVLQAVSLHDLFEWTATHEPFVYDGIDDVAPEDDLVSRALAQAQDAARWTGHLRVRKGIPAAAGLGGGSSDAALALRLALPHASDDMLLECAARIGSDVPFFLEPGTALVSGTGTVVSPLPTPRLWFVLVTPPLVIAEKTRALYRGLGAVDFTEGMAVQAIAQGLRDGQVPDAVIPNAFSNQLLSFPAVRYAYDGLLSAGSKTVSISGAGPTVYAVMKSYVEASQIAMRLPGDGGTIRVARSVAARDHPSHHAMALALRGAFERS